MKFKEVIIVVLIMLIFAMAMLMYIVINDSIKASSVPIISNNIENITCGNKNNDGDNANNKVNKIENLLINKEDSNSAEKNQKENIEKWNKNAINIKMYLYLCCRKKATNNMISNIILPQLIKVSVILFVKRNPIEDFIISGAPNILLLNQ